MFTFVQRMFVLGLVVGVAGLTGVAAVHAEDAHHDHAAMQTAKAPFAGDPYLLSTDPVTGNPLGDNPIIDQHEGRELRFTDQKSLDAFKVEPAKYLPKVDQQMIQQQLPFYPLETCMITGEKLGGSMGKPVNLIYKNRLVRFCCGSCPKDFKKDPDKYIAKLNDAVIAKQGPSFPLTTCVVSGDKIGGDMGKPVDIVAGNRLVRLCCADCPKDFNKNPLKYLKMIDDATGKKSADGKTETSETTPKSSDHSGHQH